MLNIYTSYIYRIYIVYIMLNYNYYNVITIIMVNGNFRCVFLTRATQEKPICPFLGPGHTIEGIRIKSPGKNPTTKIPPEITPRDKNPSDKIPPSQNPNLT